MGREGKITESYGAEKRREGKERQGKGEKKGKRIKGTER